MATLPADIAVLVMAAKLLASRPKWNEDSNPRYLEFVSPMIADGVIAGGFELRAKVSKHHVDRDAMFQLEYAPTGRARIELWRCCWRPFHTHTNKAWGPEGYALQKLRISHHHPFLDNWIEREERMRAGSLPGARPIDPEPSTLSEFIAFCGECFRINNMQMVEVPQRNADLFWTPDD
jgi:hypothetical protein